MTIRKGAKILIVEDELPVSEMLTRYLSKQNYSVSNVVDGLTAYKELSKDTYDVCILDLNIPDKSGIEVLNDINKKTEITTDIIVLTGISDTSKIIEVMRLGASNYMQKPFEIEELSIAVEHAIQNRKVKQENIRYKHSLEGQIIEKTSAIKKAYLDIVNAFANTIEMRDPYTGGHSNRVSVIACMMGKEMSFNKKKLEETKIGGILHDIGKIAIPDSILRKPGKLTRKEFDEIKRHPITGYEIIRNISSLKPAVPYILCHQEKYDGTGYPKGLKGLDIPVEGRLLSVADAFESMMSDRPYRKALTLESAYKEIVENSGKQFDPYFVDIFNKLWDNRRIENFITQFAVKVQ